MSGCFRQGRRGLIVEKPIAKIVVIFTILGGISGIVALAQWAKFDDQWRFTAIGFILGVMVILVPAVVLWDRPYRHEKLAREQKKIEMVQVMQTRQERVNELDDMIGIAEIEIEKAKIYARQNMEEARDYANLGSTSWELQHKAFAADWAGNAKMGETNLKKFRQERARLKTLTDDQWRAKQVAKVYVPD